MLIIVCEQSLCSSTAKLRRVPIVQGAHRVSSFLIEGACLRFKHGDAEVLRETRVEIHDRLRCELLVAERAVIVRTRPLLDALSVEIVPLVAWQR